MSTENQSRGGICMYCGYAFQSKSLEPEDIAVVYEELIAHDKQCPKNPLVKRIAELDDENKRLRRAAEFALSCGIMTESVCKKLTQVLERE